MLRTLIKEYRFYLTRQQVRTINGQYKAGDEEATLKELITILKREGIEIGNSKY